MVVWSGDIKQNMINGVRSNNVGVAFCYKTFFRNLKYRRKAGARLVLKSYKDGHLCGNKLLFNRKLNNINRVVVL